MAKNDSAAPCCGPNGAHVLIEELYITDSRIQDMVRTLARILVQKTLIEHGVKPATQDQ
jgi:hypothetical protein